MRSTQAIARKVLALLDLTNLNETDGEAEIRQLCARAISPAGSVAAVCIFPRFVATARRSLDALRTDRRIQVATVVNFPHGSPDVDLAVNDTRLAISSGADEIDLVFPWQALIDGNASIGREMVTACKQVCDKRLLKVILESGELAEPDLIRQAAELAIEGGCDFIKTSTGKVEVNATLSAATVMLETIRESGRDIGFKASGGIRQLSEAAAYLALAEQIMGEEWVNPAHFRFGASSLLDDLLAVISDTSTRPAGEFGY